MSKNEIIKSSKIIKENGFEWIRKSRNNSKVKMTISDPRTKPIIWTTNKIQEYTECILIQIYSSWNLFCTFTTLKTLQTAIYDQVPPVSDVRFSTSLKWAWPFKRSFWICDRESQHDNIYNGHKYYHFLAKLIPQL